MTFTPYGCVDPMIADAVQQELGRRLELPAPLVRNRPGCVTVFRDPGSGVTPTTTSPTLPWVHAMRQQAINFVRAIKGETEPPCAAAEALEDLKVAREYIRLRRTK